MPDTDARAIAARLTPKQRKALCSLPCAPGWIAPAELGERVGGTARMKAQGLGRLGGTIAWRLMRLKLAYMGERRNGPGYTVTEFGLRVRAALEQMEGQNG